MAAEKILGMLPSKKGLHMGFLSVKTVAPINAWIYKSIFEVIHQNRYFLMKCGTHVFCNSENTESHDWTPWRLEYKINSNSQLQSHKMWIFASSEGHKTACSYLKCIDIEMISRIIIWSTMPEVHLFPHFTTALFMNSVHIIRLSWWTVVYFTSRLNGHIQIRWG